jgi:hypothetical protein
LRLLQHWLLSWRLISSFRSVCSLIRLRIRLRRPFHLFWHQRDLRELGYHGRDYLVLNGLLRGIFTSGRLRLPFHRLLGRVSLLSRGCRRFWRKVRGFRRKRHLGSLGHDGCVLDGLWGGKRFTLRR